MSKHLINPVSKHLINPESRYQFDKSAYRIVAVRTSDQLLKELHWCLEHSGEFLSLFTHGSYIYYLRNTWYWQGMLPVETILVNELFDLGAIWTNAPSKGAGYRKLHLTEPTALQQSGKLIPAKWMTKRQAFDSLGFAQNDLVRFKPKTLSELASFGLKINKHRRRHGQPCYRHSESQQTEYDLKSD